MADTTVLLKEISKSFGKTSVLKNVSLQLESGKFYALLGRNGSGKSTLMRLLTRNELASTGTGRILDFPLDSDPNDFNEKICYVSESNEFPLFFRIGQWQIEYSKAFKSWDAKIFKVILGNLGIDESKFYQELSRGQKMQVMLACAIAQNPKVLLLDEVTSVLDPNARTFLMKYFSSLVQSGTTLVMATNIASEVQAYAQHLLIIDDQSIKVDLSLIEMSKLFVKLRKKQEQFLPVFNDPSCVEVTVNSDGSTSHIIPTSRVEPYKVTEDLLDRRVITVEEVFIYHTRKGG